MSNNIYLITYSGDRTNIRADFKLYDKESIAKEISGGNIYGRIRYAKIGNYVKLLKDMPLEEFESEFKEFNFTKEEITEYFSKEVSLIYGKHKEQKEMKKLSLKQLERWGIYSDVSGYMYIYLGKVRLTHTYNNSHKTDVTEGNGFLHTYSLEEDRENSMVGSCDVLKTNKSLFKKVGDYLGVKKDEYINQSQNYGRGNEIKTLKLL